ncbi:ATP-dependent DNA helicase UvrD2 [Corynebacterium uropygiale]|uniref:DNA 3'-5' helicase n=1 Tax=Corynebacterium uropygiale TaxID=1775911 RepID=A0A9X1TYQ7_9CORY|nr:ATP-dependent DNA helicase UvrD2 [Corynebacterium uropygiale]
MINLEDLDPQQRVAAQAPRGPVCILAGAGTGKTRTITYRIAHLIDQGFTDQRRVLALTFTTRAAGEMAQRLQRMGIGGVQALTFHAAALRQLRYFWPRLFGSLDWRPLESAFRPAMRAAQQVGLGTDTATVRDVLNEIEWAKSSLITPERYPEVASALRREIPGDPQTIAQAYRAYEDLKIQGSMVSLDFSDYLLYMAAAIENNRSVAEEFRHQYRTFIVDEYQDVTPLQQRVLDAWLGERDDLTVVGDANQTIYSFAGATPRYLLDFARTYPNATVVKLERDYRSTPQVVDLANKTISQARGRAAGTRLRLHGMRPPGPEPEFHGYDDEPTEAREVASAIATLLRRGVPAREIAILYRAGAQSPAFEQALTEAGIMYHVHGGRSFFQRPEIRRARERLTRVAQQMVEDEAYVGPRLHELVREVLAGEGLTSEPPEGQEMRAVWQSLSALATLAEEAGQKNPSLTLQGFLQELTDSQQASTVPAIDSVTLSTMHAAKGLEWDAVFLVGLSDSMLPISYAQKLGQEAIEEERRLFYVAITRARILLHCSWSLARKENGQKRHQRTRFLDGILPEVDVTSVPPRSVRPKRCRNCGRMLSTPQEKVVGRCSCCPSDADPGVFAALREWRSSVSREMNVPAYIVFTDATLVAISEAMPETLADLHDISGIGPVKIENYGEQILEVLSPFR